MKISKKERLILRELAKQKAEIASNPVNQERKKAWANINMLNPVKPVVWLDEVPWHEMDVDGDLKLQTENWVCQVIERRMRREIYQWRHMPCDMIVEPVIPLDLIVHDTNYGIDDDINVLASDSRQGSITSRHFKPQICCEDDIEKIKYSKVTYDRVKTETHFQAFSELFDGILNVEKRGKTRFIFTPWDYLAKWAGIQEILTDLIMRPDYVHKILQRMLDVSLDQLNQYEKLGLMSLNNNNVRVGTGGYGYTDELPGPDFEPDHVKAVNLWGEARAQIFGEVSPDMHKEFAIDYEAQYMARFGINYYGCCEPLHNKMHIFHDVPNLRKISLSPWADIEQAIAGATKSYVWSLKPNPAVFAHDKWNSELAEKDIRSMLNKAKGHPIEIIMKDISTVRDEPQRLWEWANIATRVTAEFFGS